MGLIDAHLHLQDPRLKNDRGAIIEDLREAGVSTWVVNGTSPEDWNEVKAIRQEWPEAIASFGLHPWRVNQFGPEGVDSLERYLSEDPEAVVGETGLDKWIRDHDIAAQKDCFLKQLELANQFNRSLTIHCLQSWGGLLECFSEVRPEKPFLLHSFGGPIEMIGKFLDLGAYFSISGHFFRADKERKLVTFDSIPSDRVLLETDAPDMLPPDELIRIPLEEGLNHPANLPSIYQAYADRYRLTFEQTVSRMNANFRAWYSNERNA